MDINCDIGEGFGNYEMMNDQKIIPLVTSVNIACGYHAGDPIIMEETVRQAIKNGVKIGAHPSYPDLQGFGRRKMDLSPKEIYAMVLYQIGALSAIVTAQKGKLHHVKPHGALYNQCASDERQAKAFIAAMKDFNEQLVLYCLSGSLMAEIAEKEGIQVFHEVFSDRNYNDDGTLVSRQHEKALIRGNQQMLEHIERILSEKKILTVNNTMIDVKADTICIHSDGEHALQFANSLSVLNIKSYD